MLIAALVLGVLLALTVAGIGIAGQYTSAQQREAAAAAEQARRSGPLPLAPVPAPEAGSAECREVLAAAPDELTIGDARVPHRALADPAPQATVAWGDAEHDPVTLRCGIDAPAELTPTSPLAEVSGVSWLEINEGGDTTWLAVDRPVYVALSTPEGTGTGTLQDISAILRERLPERPVLP
ncbi:DUF3515 domain-containing protein [Saccharopolyspora sp. HNM0983]|uniref:DUF3515 domain-containing protein n=1 Tax=Saccharopolyspora montiporae TaxID=2781240 RepID=A0A929BAG4_9PSEU|nr:DUF3515 domain-containing protein [Saccharopolyspora sp. HNM0983]